MSTLNTLSDSLADALEAVLPSLATVMGRRHRATAIAIEAKALVTAAHAVRGESAKLRLPDGQEVVARVVGRDPTRDIALLEVDIELPVPTWDDSVRVAQIVLPVATGQHSAKVTLGIIASLGGPWRTHRGGEVDTWVEVDGSLPAGFSGGPLIGANGNVIGMNTHRLVRGGTTLPATTVRRVVAALRERGTVAPGFLGIGAAPATLAPKQAEAAGRTEALLVVAVDGESPAEAAGLTVGDIVLDVDGSPVTGVRSLRGALSAVGSGNAVVLRVLRGLKIEEVQASLGGRPSHVC